MPFVCACVLLHVCEYTDKSTQMSLQSPEQDLGYHPLSLPLCLKTGSLTEPEVWSDGWPKIPTLGRPRQEDFPEVQFQKIQTKAHVQQTPNKHLSFLMAGSPRRQPGTRISALRGILGQTLTKWGPCFPHILKVTRFFLEMQAILPSPPLPSPPSAAWEADTA